MIKNKKDLYAFCIRNIDDGYGKNFYNWDKQSQEDFVNDAFIEYQKSSIVVFRDKYTRVDADQRIFK